MRWASVTTWAAVMNRPGATEKVRTEEIRPSDLARLLRLDGNDGEHRPQDVDIRRRCCRQGR